MAETTVADLATGCSARDRITEILGWIDGVLATVEYDVIYERFRTCDDAITGAIWATCDWAIEAHDAMYSVRGTEVVNFDKAFFSLGKLKGVLTVLMQRSSEDDDDAFLKTKIECALGAIRGARSLVASVCQALRPREQTLRKTLF